MSDLRDLLAVRPDGTRLADIDPGATPGLPGSKVLGRQSEGLVQDRGRRDLEGAGVVPGTSLRSRQGGHDQPEDPAGSAGHGLRRQGRDGARCGAGHEPCGHEGRQLRAAERREQHKRLLACLDDPTKHWKYDPGDLVERFQWDDYQQAYDDAVHRCSTDVAPWYVVPADRKWYRNWAVATLLRQAFADIAPDYPEPDFDVAAERAKLLAAP